MIIRDLETSSSMTVVKLPGMASIRTHANKIFDGLRKLLPILRGWIKIQRTSRSDAKRLHVAESVSLGEKRFIAVVQVDGMQFLIGGSSTNVALLAQLNKPLTFGESFEKAIDIEVPKRKRKSRSTQVAKQTEMKV
jgi:flagellar biogenesis protein FliO